MEVLSPSKKHTAALEMVSEEEEETGQESEHEEGEISSEEEEDIDGEEGFPCSVFQPANYSNNALTYASHFSSFSDHWPSKKPSLTPVASEVVIYDDSGRTAIFTSPKKSRVSSYSRRGEVPRQHARELPRRKEEGKRTRRHHSSSSQTCQEKWAKAPRRSAVESKDPGLPQEGHKRSYKSKVKEGSDARGHRQHLRVSSPDSSSRSSSCSSHSSRLSSSSDDCSFSEEEKDVSPVSPSKGRGKENRRCGPAGKSHDRSHPLEYGCEPPPAKGSSKVIAHRQKHSSSQHSSSHYRPPTPHSKGPRRRSSRRKSPKESVAGKATNHRWLHQKLSKAKSSEKKDSSKSEVSAKEAEGVASLVKGQNWLPRGSLGEMLLSRPKVASTHFAPSLQSIPRPPGDAPKTPASPVSPKKQEKEVEEVVLEAQSPSETGENATLDQEDDEELQLRLIAIQSSLRLLTDMQREGQMKEEPEEEALLTSTPIQKTNMKEETQQDTIKDISLPRKPAGGGREASENIPVIQISDDTISISGSSISEINVESLATNTTYLDEGSRGMAVEDGKGKGREQLDVDQDPVDMEICNSSGEEEEPVQESPLSPEPGPDTGTATGGEAVSGLSECMVGGGGSNFQIPVEWAYMMPPPPPPDQPANDLHNINSWCFDQNMYLQSMQVNPLEEQQQQQQQGQAEAGPDREWPTGATLTQSHNIPWVDPFLETYDNSALPQPQDTSATVSLPMNQQHQDQQQQHSHQQQQEEQQHGYAYPDPSLSQDAASLGQSNDLKDAPAEQYQAFMSAVLQQHPSPKGQVASFSECSQRNLITVPLSGSHHSASATAAKTSRKAKAKRQRMMKQLRKKQAQEEGSGGGSSSGSGNVQLQVTNTSNEAAAAAAATVLEDEDEDLLRAQLLIALSKKKEQRQLATTTTSTNTITTTNNVSTQPAALPAPPFPVITSKAGGVSREGQEGHASPQGPLQSPETLVTRSLHLAKGHGGRPRSGENSPTHTFRGEARQGLSDIGGWGLDPKGSKFNYHTTQQDFPHSSSSSSSLDPKIKFRPIERVVINLQSDSDSASEEECGSEGTPSSEPISQSIDNLLKSMRNANVASSSKEQRPASPKPGPSTSGTIPATRPREVADSTPQAVRHLSRPQQEEYRWLKEQLRKKEMIQRRKMQQRPLRAKPQPRPPPSPPPPSAAAQAPGSPLSSMEEGSSPFTSPGAEASSSARAVTWKDMGLLQIQVQNDSVLDPSSESDSGYKLKGDSSASASAVEDEDEETLRMLALLTQKKGKAESSTETQHRRATEEGTAGEGEAKESEEPPMELRSEMLDESMKGEWMVLDEVREEEEPVRSPCSVTGADCGDGVNFDSSIESLGKSPVRDNWSSNQSGHQKADKEPEIQTNKTEEAVHIGENEISQGSATPDKPASECGYDSQPETDTGQGTAVKGDTTQATEPSCNGEKVEVIRRIESKIQGLRETMESSPSEVDGDSALPQGNEKFPVRCETQAKVTPPTEKVTLTQETNATLVKPSHATSTTVPSSNLSTIVEAAGGQDQSKVAVSKPVEGKVTHHRTVIVSNGTQRTVRLVNNAMAVGKETASGVVAGAHGGVKSTKSRLQLKGLEKEYKEKKSGISRMLKQLSQLLKEVNDEQQQRQELKRHILELRAKLREMENQYESKGGAMQTKMELIKHLQVQLGTEREAVSRLENQGEKLGQQLHGSGYSFSRSLPMSPRSKVKEASTKKDLARSIHALQQQVKDLTNKHKTTTKIPTTASTTTTETGVVRKLNTDITKASGTTTTAGVVMWKHSMGDKNIKITSNTTTTMGTTISTSTSTITTTQGPEERTVKLLNVDSKKEAAPGRKILHSSLKFTPGLQGVSRVPPAHTRGKAQGAKPPQGHSLLMKRKMGATSLSSKVARVQVPAESQQSAMTEREKVVLASEPKRATTEGAVKGDELDVNKLFCSHDLLGRCNDSACEYQHVPSPQTQTQAQTFLSSSQKPKTANRGGTLGGEPHTTTGTTRKGKAVQRKGAVQVKVVTSDAVEVNSKVLVDLHDSDHKQQFQTEIATQRDLPTTENKEHTHTDTTDTQIHTTQHQTEAPDKVTPTADKPADRCELKGTCLVTSESLTMEGVMTESGLEMQTDAPTEKPQETHMETKTSADGLPATTEAQKESMESQAQMGIVQGQEESITELQAELEASTAYPESQTARECPQTVTGGDVPATEETVAPQSTVEKTNIVTSVTSKQRGNLDTSAETEDKDTSLSDMESVASACSSVTSRPNRRRTRSRKSKESSTELAPNQDLQSEGEPTTEHQENTRVTRTSLRVKANVTPPGNGAKSTAGKGQKRKSQGKESPSKRPSAKRRHSSRL